MGCLVRVVEKNTAGIEPTTIYHKNVIICELTLRISKSKQKIAKIRYFNGMYINKYLKIKQIFKMQIN